MTKTKTHLFRQDGYGVPSHGCKKKNVRIGKGKINLKIWTFDFVMKQNLVNKFPFDLTSQTRKLK